MKIKGKPPQTVPLVDLSPGSVFKLPLSGAIYMKLGANYFTDPSAFGILRNTVDLSTGLLTAMRGDSPCLSFKGATLDLGDPTIQ